MSIADVKATIKEGIDASDEVQQMIATIRDAVSSAQALAVATTHDSSHPAVTGGLASLREADHEAELVLRRIHVSAEAAGRYLGTLG